MLVQVGASNIAIEADRVFLSVLWSLNDVKSVCDDVSVLGAPRQISDLLNGNETRQIVDFGLWIGAIRLQA